MTGVQTCALPISPIRRVLITQNQTDGNELDDEGAAKQLLDVWEDDRQSRQMAWEEAAVEAERERAKAEAENHERRRREKQRRRRKRPSSHL